MKKIISLFCLVVVFSGCTSTTTNLVKKVRFEETLDVTKKQAGCFTYIPGPKGVEGEVTLMTFETCMLIIPSQRK